MILIRMLLNRLLHAVTEQKEEEESSVLQQELISGLAELYQTSRGADAKKGKKREKTVISILSIF